MHFMYELELHEIFNFNLLIYYIILYYIIILKVGSRSLNLFFLGLWVYLG
jgi:hypothetical protein